MNIVILGSTENLVSPSSSHACFLQTWAFSNIFVLECQDCPGLSFANELKAPVHGLAIEQSVMHQVDLLSLRCGPPCDIDHQCLRWKFQKRFQLFLSASLDVYSRHGLVDHKLYLFCSSSLHASSLQTLSRLRSCPRQLSRLVQAVQFRACSSQYFRTFVSRCGSCESVDFTSLGRIFLTVRQAQLLRGPSSSTQWGADTGELRFLLCRCAVCVDTTTTKGQLGLGPTASRSKIFLQGGFLLRWSPEFSSSRMGSLVTCRNVCTTRELKGHSGDTFDGHCYHSPGEPVRVCDVTRVDDLLKNSGLDIMVRFSGTCKSTPAQKSEVRAHQMPPGGVVTHLSSWTVAAYESCEGLFPPLLGLCHCDCLPISTFDFRWPARPALARRLSQDSLHPSACLLRRHLHCRSKCGSHPRVGRELRIANILPNFHLCRIWDTSVSSAKPPARFVHCSKFLVVRSRAEP